MSYARWGLASDVYVFAHYLGYVDCCDCVLGHPGDLHSAADVVAHMREHVAAGHRVPAHLLDESEYDPSDFTPEAAI